MALFQSVREHLKSLTIEQVDRLRFLFVISIIVSLIPLLLIYKVEARCSHVLLETDESEYYLPTSEWLVPLSLGYREAMAGGIWVRLLVYFGEQIEVRGHNDYLEAYLDGVVTLDPYFYRAYTWGSAAAIYNSGAIDREDVELSIRMLERGLERFPNDGELHYQLGFLYYMELRPFLSGIEQERVRQLGMDEICTAAILGGGPPYLPLVCSSLAQRLGMEGIGAELMAQSLLDTADESMRSAIEDRLELLTSVDNAYRIAQPINELRMNWERDFPYVPIDLYVLMGPRGGYPPEDQLTLPLPMDAVIRAGEEQFWYQVFQADDYRPSADAPIDLSTPPPVEEERSVPSDEP